MCGMSAITVKTVVISALLFGEYAVSAASVTDHFVQCDVT